MTWSRVGLLVINAGSSSIKFKIFSTDASHRVVYEGLIEGITTPKTALTFQDADGHVLFEGVREDRAYEHKELAIELLTWLNEKDINIISAGHRVAHGEKYTQTMLVDKDVIEYLKEHTMSLAPNHAPANIASIEALLTEFPDLPQVMCFDTSFHRTNPAIISEYAIDPKYNDDGIVVSYGFHGISYKYIASQLSTYLDPEIANGKIIIAHLGNGASMCAMENGKSIDTTMGFTPLDGLMMGTRAGTIDPGALLYIMRQFKMSIDDVEAMISKKSGLLGVSQINSDMRPIVEAYHSDANAKKAVDMFTMRVAHYFGKLMVSIQGCDALIFTGGIGENAVEQRRQIIENLEFLGFKLDKNSNETRGQAQCISASDSSIPIWIIPTNEELMIALDTQKLLQA